MPNLKRVSIWKQTSPNFSSINGISKITNEIDWFSHPLHLNSEPENIYSVFATYTKITPESEGTFFNWLKSLVNLTELEISYSNFSDKHLISYFFSKEAQSLERISINGNHYMLNLIPRQNIKYIECNIVELSEIPDIIDRFPNLETLQVVCLKGTNDCESSIVRALYNHPNIPRIRIFIAKPRVNPIEEKLIDPSFYHNIEMQRTRDAMYELLLCYNYPSRNNCSLNNWFNNVRFDINLLLHLVNEFLMDFN